MLGSDLVQLSLFRRLTILQVVAADS